MRVSLGTVEVTDSLRRSLNDRLGRPGLATREQVRNWALSAVEGAADDLLEDEDENP